VSVPRTHPGTVVALALVALCARARAADMLYVVEQVVVSVNSSADGSGERVASLKSGDRVELIERAGEAVHVRLADGKDGWLRAIYLSGDEPMRPRLQQSEAEVTRLRAEVGRLQGELSAAAGRQSVAPPTDTASAQDPAANTPGAMFSATPDTSPPRLWPWVLGATLLALALGFALGWRMLDRTIRKKYGGLKIY
jgi:hypothetical protein